MRDGSVFAPTPLPANVFGWAMLAGALSIVALADGGC